MKLEVRDLAFGYPSKRVGAGVSFELAAGEVMCLLGPNGGGKTTLFKTILGLIPAQGGAVLYGEAPLKHLARAEVARIAGYVPQAHTGYFPFSVLDVVLMGRASHMGPFAAPGRRDREIARAALATIGIERLADAVSTRISVYGVDIAVVEIAAAEGPRRVCVPSLAGVGDRI